MAKAGTDSLLEAPACAYTDAGPALPCTASQGTSRHPAKSSSHHCEQA